MAKRRMPPRYKSGPKKGQFMSKRARAARHRRHNPEVAAPAATNPRRRRARRNPMTVVTKRGRRYSAPLPKKGSRARKRYQALTHHATRSAKARKKLRSMIVSASRKRKGGHTVAKKRRAHKGKRSHRSYVLAGKKAARTRAAKKAHRRAAAKKSHRKVRRTQKTHTRKTYAPRRRRRVTHRRVRRLGRRGITFRQHPKRGSRKYRRYTLRSRYGKIGKRQGVRFTVRRNPTVNGVKDMLMDGAMLYGGLMGMRVVRNLITKYVVPSLPASISGSLGKYAGLLPAVGAFAIGLFAPKFIKGNDKLLRGVQAGATLVLLEAVMDIVVKPLLPASVTSLMGTGYAGYGGEYIRQRTRLPYQGYGAVAREAVAEYVQQPMGAFDVNEALADSEVDGMQRGYAAGSLARTVFSS
jgi:hypothetical protein